MKRALVIAACALLALPGVSHAGNLRDSLMQGWRNGGDQNQAYREKEQGRILPLNRVIDIVGRAAGGGRFLDAGLEADGRGRQIYRVRWSAPDGRRIDYLVDAQSGRILGTD